MAKIIIPKQIPPTELKRFLGLNENIDGEYGLKLGEAVKQVNWRISPQFQLKEREGFKTKFTLSAGNIQGMWHGKLAGTPFFLFCHGGHLYSGNLTDGTKTDLGTLTDAPTRFIPFGSKVYLNNGTEYKSFDGTTFAVVAGHRPKIAISTPPAGGGTLYDQINVLTGAKHQTFSPDGVATAYQLAETSITSVDFVKVNGVTKTLTTDYTVNLTTGVVTFVVSPTGGVPNNVDIGWTKGTGSRSLIEKCRFSMDYSGESDSRVFLWGNTDYKNRRFWSGLADGVPSAEYFEAGSYYDEGNGQYAITDITKQYNSQKIFMENGARYSNYATQTINGIVVADFPSYELSDEVGNVAFGQVQTVHNNPLTIYNGVHSWAGSTVKDQTNQVLISQRVQDSLMSLDLTTAITYNWQENSEYWLCVGSTVWIYNYLNDTWYKFDNINAKCFLVVNGAMYFGTNGTIEKFDPTLRHDNSTAITAICELGFTDFGAEYLNKYMNNIWVTIKPDTTARLDVAPVTNNDGTGDYQTIRYSMATFIHQDFNNMSFLVTSNPQPFYMEVEAMEFVYFKLILKNSSLSENCTVLSITMPARMGGRVD